MRRSPPFHPEQTPNKRNTQSTGPNPLAGPAKPPDRHAIAHPRGLHDGSCRFAVLFVPGAQKLVVEGLVVEEVALVGLLVDPPRWDTCFY